MGLLCSVQAQDSVQELELAIEGLQKQNAVLRQQLLEVVEEQSAPLSEALAASNLEVEKYRELYKNLLLVVESLGLETLKTGEARQDRMIKAVRELKMIEDENGKLEQQLMELSEAIMEYVNSSSSVDAAARLSIEAALRSTDELLGFGMEKRQESDTKLSDSRVISYKEEFQLAVLNVGRRSGVKIGMPMNILRKDRLVGTALVVDVRDSISGAIIQEIFTEGDQITVQDRAEPRTTATNNL